MRWILSEGAGPVLGPRVGIRSQAQIGLSFDKNDGITRQNSQCHRSVQFPIQDLMSTELKRRLADCELVFIYDMGILFL